MKLNRTLFTSAMLAAAVGACSDDDKPVTGNARPITKDEVTTFSVANSRALLTEVWDLRKWLDQTDTASAFEDVIPFGDEGAEPGEQIDPIDYDAELADVLEAVEDFLKTRLLEVSTVETEERTAVTYKLDAERLCDYDPAAEPVLDDLGEPMTEGKDCYDFISASELRVKVTSFAQGDLDATVLAGAGRDAVLRFELHHDLASAEVDFAAAAGLFQSYLDATGDDEGTVQGSGKARVVARRLADDQMRISAEVLEAIELHLDADDDANDIELTFAEGSFAIDVDAPGDAATLDIDMGAFAMRGAKTILPFVDDGCYEIIEVIDGEEITYLECDSETPALEGTGAVSFGGLKAYIDFDDSQQTFAVRGLVLGKLGIVADDKTIIEVGGDATAPATDVTFTLDATDHMVLELSRAFELSGMFRTAQAPGLIDLGDWAADEDLAIVLGGEKPALRLDDNGLIVQAGSLTLESKHARDTSLEIAAGMCLYVADDEESDHPFDLSTAAQCPVPEEVF